MTDTTTTQETEDRTVPPWLNLDVACPPEDRRQFALCAAQVMKRLLPLIGEADKSHTYDAVEASARFGNSLDGIDEDLYMWLSQQVGYDLFRDVLTTCGKYLAAVAEGQKAAMYEAGKQLCGYNEQMKDLGWIRD